MQRLPFYNVPSLIVMMLIMSFSAVAAPSRFEVMKTMKWRVVDVLEQNLHAGLLSGQEKQIIEYTLYKIKSSIGQYTNREFFEDIYYQTYNLVKIKEFVKDSEHRAKIDNLIQLYQAVLKEMYTDN